VAALQAACVVAAIQAALGCCLFFVVAAIQAACVVAALQAALG